MEHGEELLSRFRHWEPVISERSGADALVWLFAAAPLGCDPGAVASLWLLDKLALSLNLVRVCVHAEPEFIGGTGYGINPAQPKVRHLDIGVAWLHARMHAYCMHTCTLMALSAMPTSSPGFSCDASTCMTLGQQAAGATMPAIPARRITPPSPPPRLPPTRLNGALQLKFTPNYDYFDELKKGDHL